jgi:hypothetical protein
MPERTAELLALARARIGSGELPRLDDPTVWAGPGTGKPCALCGTSVLQTETGYEAEVKAKGALAAGALQLHFHITCHSAWILVCNERARASTD